MDGDGSSYGALGILILATLLYLFASLAESVVGALSRARVQRLAERDEAAANRILDFAERPVRYLSSIAVLKPAALVAAVVTLLQIFTHQTFQADALLAWAVAVLAALVLGWIIPHAVVSKHPEDAALALAVPLRVSAFLFAPLARLVAAATSGLSNLLGTGPVPEGPLVTPAELKVMVAASEEEGLIERQERTMIDNVLELEEKTVREVMVPRPDIVALPADTSVREAIDTFVREGYSRLPVYRGTIDDIIGVVYGKDLLPLTVTERLGSPVGEFVRPAYFVPESKKADALLRELQQQRVHIAIVVDEYGGTAGLVTIEDLLEEIVGEIQDEYDTEEQKIVRVSEDEALVDGGVTIDDANEELGLDLAAEEVDTVGGLVHEKLGRIPVVGDKVTLDHAVLTVVSSSGRRVTRVRINRIREDVDPAPSHVPSESTGGRYQGERSGRGD
ncbi:MAG: HlyC/CorC family transporter [Chloroflexi bacterium]|nr:HlyC/CorC family transporter [Chloroflexota bacterium]